MIWNYIEWFGTIFGLSGTIIMASKKINHDWAWKSWFLSNIFLISLFTYTKQYGLLSMSVFGLFTCAFGYWQWSQHKSIHINAMKSTFMLSIVGLMIAAALLIAFLFNPQKFLIEWFGSTLCISGALLLASKHKNASLSWIIWAISNVVLFCFAIQTKQWGFATLQLGFTLANTYGIIVWFWLNKER